MYPSFFEYSLLLHEIVVDCYPSIKTITKEMNLSVNIVKRAIAGFISKRKWRQEQFNVFLIIM